jgi:hypothetical protein
MAMEPLAIEWKCWGVKDLRTRHTFAERSDG